MYIYRLIKVKKQSHFHAVKNKHSNHINAFFRGGGFGFDRLDKIKKKAVVPNNNLWLYRISILSRLFEANRYICCKHMRVTVL